jgi:hypothetical protein
MIKNKKVAEIIEYKFTFHEGDGVYELKEELATIPEYAEFSHVEPHTEFDHEITFVFRAKESVKEELCKCGHPYIMHHSGIGKCYFRKARFKYCSCKTFDKEGLPVEIEDRMHCKETIGESGRKIIACYSDVKPIKRKCNVRICNGNEATFRIGKRWYCKRHYDMAIGVE